MLKLNNAHLSALNDETNKYLILKSPMGIDYTRLQQLLSQQQWQAANEKTAKKNARGNGAIAIVQWIASGTRNPPISPGRFFDFGYWVKYSQNRFGFSISGSLKPCRLKSQSSIMIPLNI